ncbi:MAG TPA: hypothetical protein VN794_07290 [Methylomirabilota bacterium]|nr:hypothetical protein [Methylomirabilota bacterium]
MKILFKHLGKHHPQEMQEGAMLAKELPAYLILSAFDHEDPSMGPRLEMIRAAIFALVRKNSMSDDNLAYIVSGLGLDKDDEQKVNEAFRAVRDAVCEFGQFAPQQVQESRIIPV